jgi:hypothetical protein
MRYTWFEIGVCRIKAVVDGFMACDLVTHVLIDIRVYRFLIGNPGDVKLVVQSEIND